MPSPMSRRPRSVAPTQPCVEAMGRGAAIVANDVPEHREVLADAGRYYARNDPTSLGKVLQEVVADAPARIAMGAAAAARAEAEFSWEHVTDRYEALFRALAG